MESKGMHESSSGLAVVSPRNDIMNFFSGSSADGGKGSNNGNGRELALVDMTNRPASNGGDEEDVPIFSTEMEGEEEKGPSSSQPGKYMRLSPRQFGWLEAAFEQSHSPDMRTMEALAEKLNVSPRQVQLWFANRRSRLFKQLLKQSEMQRDSYKQQVSLLTKEKRCLESELAKLKATAPAPPPPDTPVLLPIPGPVQAFVELCHDCECTFRSMVAAPPPPAAPVPAQESVGLCHDCRRTFRTMAAAAASLAQPQGGASVIDFLATTSAPPPPSSTGGSI